MPLKDLSEKLLPNSANLYIADIQSFIIFYVLAYKDPHHPYRGVLSGPLPEYSFDLKNQNSLSWKQKWSIQKQHLRI